MFSARPALPSRPTVRRALALTFLAAAASHLVGCQPQPAAPTSAPAVQIELSRPEDAARSVLRVLREQRRRIAAGERRAADALTDRMLKGLVARDRLEELTTKVLRGTGQKSSREDIEAAMRRAVNGWGALVGYYVDTVDLDQASLDMPIVRGVTRVRIPTGRPESRTPIRVTCVQGPDSLWRVLTVDFATASPNRTKAASPHSAAAASPTTAATAVPATAPAVP